MADLQSFAGDVWTVEGPPVRFMGLPFPTRMNIVKLANGSLWIDSPVTVPAEGLRQIEALGKVRYLVSPTRLHVWRLEEWHQLFPEAQLWGPSQIPRQFKRLPFSGTLEDTAPPDWTDDIDQLVFRGNLFIEEVVFFHRASRTVILADFIQSHRPVQGRPLVNLLLKLDGIAYPRAGVPRDIRLSFTDRHLAKRCLDRLLSWDFDRLIIAHGVCIQDNAKSVVEEAFRWLRR